MAHWKIFRWRLSYKVVLYLSFWFCSCLKHTYYVHFNILLSVTALFNIKAFTSKEPLFRIMLHCAISSGYFLLSPKKLNRYPCVPFSNSTWDQKNVRKKRWHFSYCCTCLPTAVSAFLVPPLLPAYLTLLTLTWLIPPSTWYIQSEMTFRWR